MAAWDMVKGMFPNQELIALTTEDEAAPSQDLSLEQWGDRS